MRNIHSFLLISKTPRGVQDEAQLSTRASNMTRLEKGKSLLKPISAYQNETMLLGKASAHTLAETTNV